MLCYRSAAMNSSMIGNTLSAMRRDEIFDLRRNDFSPPASGEDAVMAAFRCGEMLLHRFRNRRAQVERGLGLTRTGDIVEFAFNGEKGNVLDVLRPYQLALDFPCPRGQTEFLENGLDG